LESSEEKFQNLENRIKEREYNILAEIENVCFFQYFKFKIKKLNFFNQD
jgi:hypothetical protein